MPFLCHILSTIASRFACHLLLHVFLHAIFWSSVQDSQFCCHFCHGSCDEQHRFLSAIFQWTSQLHTYAPSPILCFFRSSMLTASLGDIRLHIHRFLLSDYLLQISSLSYRPPFLEWWSGKESNRRCPRLQRVTLPAELPDQ